MTALNENEEAMSRGVETFLQSIGLQSYASVFLAKGYDRETDLHHLEDDDLDTMLITDLGHRRALISAARKHSVSEDGKLLDWLRHHELEHYFVGFVRSELVDLEDVARLNLPDEDIYDELEIAMPGHKRRLERAVRQLNKRRKHDEKAEVPVAEGFWGKPRNLEDAKYDFLCVEATISSTLDASRSHKIDFMVDSGSDVTTLQEDLLYTLNPELLGPINSKGVHSSKRKNLYKAKLTIGTQELDIEVMGECYNSLGSRVLRHFRHYITGSKHIWLPGDYFDPTMSTGLQMAITSGQNSTEQTASLKDSDLLKQKTLPSSEDSNTLASNDTHANAKGVNAEGSSSLSGEQIIIQSQDKTVSQKSVSDICKSESADRTKCDDLQASENSDPACEIFDDEEHVQDGVDGEISLHNSHVMHNNGRYC